MQARYGAIRTSHLRVSIYQVRAVLCSSVSVLSLVGLAVIRGLSCAAPGTIQYCFEQYGYACLSMFSSVDSYKTFTANQYQAS